MNSGSPNARLVALCAFGCMLLSYPLMSLFNVAKVVFGIPLLHVYLFLVWLAFIALSAIVVESRGK
jgi:hypothetical protein